MAKYRRNKVSLDDEMNIVIGAIVSDKYLRNIKLLIAGELDLLKSRYLRIILGWCFSYFDKHKASPKGTITDIFKAETDNIPNEDDIDLIEDTLENINQKYIEDGASFDADYIYPLSEKYIKGRSLVESAEKIKGLVAQNRIDEAELEQKEYKRKEKSSVGCVEAFTDMDAIEEMFEFEESVIDIPGALGELIQEVYKGDLIFPAALSKRGKTWFLLQLALWGAQQGLRIGFWTFEMNSKLINRRLAQTILGKSFKKKKDFTYVPEFDYNNNIIYKKHKVKQMQVSDVKRSYKKLNRMCGEGGIWFFDSTKSGRTVDAIVNTIENSAEYDDLHFDMIIIDQLSLLEGGRGNQKRLQLDDLAIRLKTEICERYQIPVVTPLQYNADAGKTNQGNMFNLNEAKSLFHHASLLININSSDEEVERGVARISCSGRHNSFHGEVVILQNLDIGRYVMDSRWKRDIPNYSSVICEDVFDEEDESELEDV